MYWTAHLEDGPLGDPNPAVAVGCRIYSFGWPSSTKKPSEQVPMHVHALNTENLSWSKVLPTSKDEQSSSYPRHRFGHSAVVYEDKIYIWGGMFNEHFFDELLCFDPVTSSWSIPKVSGTVPQTRNSHFAFVIEHSMYLIGGYDRRTKKYSPDVFALDLRTMQWKYIAAHSGPYMWEGISACAVGHRIYIFGGELYRSHWNGGSFLDTVSGRWHRIVICESCHLTWKSPAFVHENSIYVFGGTCPKSNWDGIYLLKLATDTNRWVEVHMPGMSPIPHVFHACVVVSCRVFVFGAKCRFAGNHVDLHIVDFRPSLYMLCLRVVLQHRLDIKNLPKALRMELLGICAHSRLEERVLKLQHVYKPEHGDCEHTSGCR
ncbi:hypothetical protein R5R35_008749 [Gryllus longicercus]|uniref:Uncharacterized protein n=1 Tax=Gryllus longicercus TaxID=2509291 RepID=A0AAN9Z6W6_9ORTH